MEAVLKLVRGYPDQVNAFVAVLALVVSALSIILTFVSLYLQRRHNYKSLVPIASIPVADYQDKLAVKLKNTGVGPLIIERFWVTDGARTEQDLISFMPDLPNGMAWYTFTDTIDGACIPPGESLIILQLNGDPDDERFAEARDSCRQALRALTVSVTYKDIYERPMPKRERSLTWFGRHFEHEESSSRHLG